MGNLLAIKVHAANIHDTISGCSIYQTAKNKYFSLEGVCGDAGYRGTFVDFVKMKYRDIVDISKQIKPEQWNILPKRWRVERTFSWANWSRILSKDYEIRTIYQENIFIISHLHTLLKHY
jgi:putative transposase